MLSGAAKAVEQAAGSVLPNKQGQFGDDASYSDDEPRWGLQDSPGLADQNHAVPLGATAVFVLAAS